MQKKATRISSIALAVCASSTLIMGAASAQAQEGKQTESQIEAPSNQETEKESGKETGRGTSKDKESGKDTGKEEDSKKLTEDYNPTLRAEISDFQRYDLEVAQFNSDQKNSIESIIDFGEKVQPPLHTHAFAIAKDGSKHSIAHSEQSLYEFLRGDWQAIEVVYPDGSRDKLDWNADTDQVASAKDADNMAAFYNPELHPKHDLSGDQRCVPQDAPFRAMNNWVYLPSGTKFFFGKDADNLREYKYASADLEKEGLPEQAQAWQDASFYKLVYPDGSEKTHTTTDTLKDSANDNCKVNVMSGGASHISINYQPDLKASVTLDPAKSYSPEQIAQEFVKDASTMPEGTTVAALTSDGGVKEFNAENLGKIDTSSIDYYRFTYSDNTVDILDASVLSLNWEGQTTPGGGTNNTPGSNTPGSTPGSSTGSDGSSASGSGSSTGSDKGHTDNNSSSANDPSGSSTDGDKKDNSTVVDDDEGKIQPGLTNQNTTGITPGSTMHGANTPGTTTHGQTVAGKEVQTPGPKVNTGGDVEGASFFAKVKALF